MPKPIKLEGWSEGLNTVLRSDSLPPNALRRAVNFDIDDLGKLEVRQGRTQVYAGTIQRGSLGRYAGRTLFVEGGHLKELFRRADGTYSAVLIRSNVGTFPMSYLELNGEVYYTNGLITGKLDLDGDDVSWGVPVPDHQPTLAAYPTGRLAAGKYQVALTYVSATGEESGARLAAVVDVPENGLIECTAFPTAPSNVAAVRLYVSHVNGEGLFRYGEAAAPVSYWQISQVSNVATVMLETQFCEPPSAGHLLEYHDGRIFVARGNILEYTRPLRYGCTRRSRDFLQFPGFITVVKAISDGIFVCADQTYWIKDVGTTQMEQRVVRPYGGVYDTGIHLPNWDAVAWFSKKGLCFGGRNGEVLNVMNDRVTVSEYGSGAMFFREHNGLRQLIANLWDANPTAFGAEDFETLESARVGASYQ